MDFPKAGDLQSETTCSVCLELVTHERSMAKLICGHMFHLDCVGSAFNAKGSMQCPNCRRTENGDWLYGNGHPHLDNSTLNMMMFEDEYDVEYEMFARLLIPEDYTSHWCPYQGINTHAPMSLRNEDRPPTPYPEVEVDVLVGEDLESTLSLQPSPSAHAQAPRRASDVEENVGLLANSARLRFAAAYQQHLSPSIEWRGRQSLEAVEPNGVAGGIGVDEGSAGRSRPGQSRHDSRRRRSLPYPGLSSPTSQWLPRPSSLRYRGTPAMQDAVSEPQPRSITNSRQWRRDGSSRSGQHPSEAEGQRWAPPPLLGLPGTGGSLVSQVAHSDHHVQAHSDHQVQALLHLDPSGENIDVRHSRSFYPPWAPLE